MKIKTLFVIGLSLLCAACVEAEEHRDRAKVEQLLKDARVETEGNPMVYFAKQLKGTPYGAGTLDAQTEEQLVVRLDSVDCVTFVENVLALTLCDKADRRTFGDFRKQLQQIRYRDGKIEGYGSRLHYFTEWIENNVDMGLVKEVTTATEGAQERVFDLNFMSEHRSAYPVLEADDAELAKIVAVEKRKVDYRMPYIPKNILNRKADSLDVRDGDILALTTSIDGLDVVHTGIACWKDGALHLIHASSVKGEVIVDETTLYDYLKGKKRNTGVRVVRVKEEKR